MRPWISWQKSNSHARIGYEIDAPRCSVIVPLHGRIDFMEYQLAFAPSSWGTSTRSSAPATYGG